MTLEPMETPFEPGTLEHRLVQGIFYHIFNNAHKASKDVHRLYGITVMPEVVVRYKVEEIIAMADYIRNHPEEMKFDTTEYIPTYFNFHTQ